MATKTMMPTMTAEPILHPNETPALKAARAALAPVAARDEELTKLLQRYEHVLTSFSALDDERRISYEDRLEAEANIGSTRVESARTTLERRRLEADIERIREAEREKVRVAFHARKRQAVAAFKAKLLAAKDASDELRDIQFAEHEMLAEPFDALSWQEFGVRFEEWAKTVKAYGLD